MKNPVTTISGAVLLLISSFGLVSQDEMPTLSANIPQAIEAIYGIYLMFGARDGRLKNNI